jgi:ABC-type amino acid transport substrate-binding protein
LNSCERKFTVLKSRETYTWLSSLYLQNTTGKGYVFSTPYLYSGLTFGGDPSYLNCALNNDTISTTTTTNCSLLRVCVVHGTTFEQEVQKIFPNEETVVPVPNVTALYIYFQQDRCQVLAADRFETAKAALLQTGGFNTGEFDKYDESIRYFTKDPLAMVTRQNDSMWSDFVNWVILALFRADEVGFSSFPETAMFGQQYKDMFSDAIAEVGSYGDLYDDYLQNTVSRAEVNDIVKDKQKTGLLYAMPFGRLELNGTPPIIGSTLHTISSRGHLRCGVSDRPMFGSFNATTNEWSGFDVDFCRALSAAIFHGSKTNVTFVKLTADERFGALHEKRVDVLSRITTVTLARDVLEASTRTGFSFSQPTFYDGVRFGGEPM